VTVISCPACDERLLDRLDAHTVTIAGRRYRFRRGSDHIVCDACGAVHRIVALRAAAVARGELAPEGPGAAGEPEDAVVGEIVDALAPTGEQPDGPADEPADGPADDPADDPPEQAPDEAPLAED
jgi:hypothetical protein